MNENNPMVVKDLEFLYDLSTSIGQSDDVEENCESFMSRLKSAQDLSSISYWYKKGNELLPQFIYGISQKKSPGKELSIASIQLEGLEKENIEVVDVDLIREDLMASGFWDDPYFLVLRTKESFLILNRKEEQFSPSTGEKLKKVVQRFDQNIQQLFLKQALEDEIALRKKTGIALKKYIESNLQLENFTYIATHDLKAPLRIIESFSKLLDEKVNDKISEKERKFLTIIRESSAKMLLLIDDLLLFSKVNKGEIQIEEFSPTDLVRAVVERMSMSEESLGVTIEVHELPGMIKADKLRVRKLFQCLISNAIRFKRVGVEGEVDIYGEENEQYWIFKVKDNGIGIKKEFYGKIFEIFQKLHSSQYNNGSGVGLSICKKAVEQHHGKIEVESEVNVGSCFTFYLSKFQPKPYT